MAEVLITLAIIGVVVAMTIPSLMYRHKQITTVNKVKNFYSKMNNLMVHVIQNNAELKYLDFPDPATAGYKAPVEGFWAYFKPYLSVAKDCGTIANSGCMPNVVTNLSNKNTYSGLDNASYYKARLKDGGSIWLNVEPGHCTITVGDYQNSCASLYYDVNGLKGPNTIGRDVFVFYILSNEIVPSRNDDCNKNGQGDGCANYILLNENMDYLK